MILDLATNPRNSNGVILKTGELLISQSGYHFRFAEGFSKMYKTSGEFEKCSAQLEMVPREIRKDNNGFQLEIFIPRVGHFYSRLTSFTETLKFIWFQFLKVIRKSTSIESGAVLAFATLASLLKIEVPSVSKLTNVSRNVAWVFQRIVIFTFYTSVAKAIADLDLIQVVFIYLKQLFFLIFASNVH